MKILLIRHAEIAEGSDPHAHYEPPVSGCLSPRGEEQARALAGSLRGTTFDRLFSSPLGRALQTAQALGEPAVIEVLPWLEEWKPAQNKGIPTRFEDMAGHWNALPPARRLRTPLGESTYAMADRIIPAFVDLLADMGAEHEGDGFRMEPGAGALTLAFVAHGGSLNVLARFLAGLAPSPRPLANLANTACLRFDFSVMGPLAYPVVHQPAQQINFSLENKPVRG
jgi:broad specificity phosphatase PhoE